MHDGRAVRPRLGEISSEIKKKIDPLRVCLPGFRDGIYNEVCKVLRSPMFVTTMK